MGKGSQILEGGSGIFIKNFTSQLLFDFLFTYRLKDVVSIIIHFNLI